MPAPTAQFLQAGCPSCRPTNSVKALKETTISQRHLSKNRATIIGNVIRRLGYYFRKSLGQTDRHTDRHAHRDTSLLYRRRSNGTCRTFHSLGGAISNLYGVELARQRALPDCKSQGLTGARRLVMFTSEQVRGTELYIPRSELRRRKLSPTFRGGSRGGVTKVTSHPPGAAAYFMLLLLCV